MACATVPLSHIISHVHNHLLTVLHLGGRLHKLITCRKGSVDGVRPSHNMDKHLQPILLTIIMCIIFFLLYSMAQAVAFQAALTRIGFSQAAVTAMNNNGINSTVDLISLNDKDTAKILKII
jgi:diacylglycerol kinase